jgi:hypothetical protein
VNGEEEVRSKTCLTLPTLLEMSGNATYRELAWRRAASVRANELVSCPA